MQQIQALSQSINQLLVLSSILTQVNLGLTITWIVIVLAFVQEVSVWLVVVFVEDRHVELLSQLPTSLIVRIILM